jgi:hypothetical protein
MFYVDLYCHSHLDIKFKKSSNINTILNLKQAEAMNGKGRKPQVSLFIW